MQYIDPGFGINLLSTQAAEWHSRAVKFDIAANKVNTLATKLNDITNRELLYEIYPYLWDIRGVISLLNSYVKWLGKLHNSYNS